MNTIWPYFRNVILTLKKHKRNIRRIPLPLKLKEVILSKKWFLSGLCCLIVFLSGCLKDRNVMSAIPIPGPGGSNQILPGTVVINEFMATGSMYYNELVTPADSVGSDWIELYNTTNDTLLLKSGQWFITDSLPNSQKFELPAITLYPHQYSLIWADGFDTVITQIHSNFKLSKSGEDIGLYYVKTPGESFFVDQLTFATQQNGSSFERLPDGSNNWGFSTQPSPNAPNR